MIYCRHQAIASRVWVCNQENIMIPKTGINDKFIAFADLQKKFNIVISIPKHILPPKILLRDILTCKTNTEHK